MTTATKTKSNSKPAKPAKPAKAAAPALTPLDVLKPGEKKRDRGGRKQQVYDMVTRKGVTLRALLAAAEKEDTPTDRVQTWVQSWVRRGYLAID